MEFDLELRVFVGLEDLISAVDMSDSAVDVCREFSKDFCMYRDLVLSEAASLQFEEQVLHFTGDRD